MFKTTASFKLERSFKFASFKLDLEIDYREHKAEKCSRLIQIFIVNVTCRTSSTFTRFLAEKDNIFVVLSMSHFVI